MNGLDLGVERDQLLGFQQMHDGSCGAGFARPPAISLVTE